MQESKKTFVHVFPGFRLSLGKWGDIRLSQYKKYMTDPECKVYFCVGETGTKLDWRHTLNKSVEATQGAEKIEAPLPVDGDYYDLDEDGTLIVAMRDGRHIGNWRTRRLVQIGEGVAGFVDFFAQHLKNLNKSMRDVINVHIQAPAPNVPRLAEKDTFIESYPSRIMPDKIWGWIMALAMFLSIYVSSGQPLYARVCFAILVFAFVFWIRCIVLKKKKQAIRNNWEKRREQFEEFELYRLAQWEAIKDNPAKAKEFLRMCLQTFDWPRLMLFDYYFEDNQVVMEMDLPELDELPNHFWTIHVNGVSLKRNRIAPEKLSEIYNEHIYSLSFLAIAVIFWSLPWVKEVVFSAYLLDKKAKDTKKQVTADLLKQTEEQEDILFGRKSEEDHNNLSQGIISEERLKQLEEFEEQQSEKEQQMLIEFGAEENRKYFIKFKIKREDWEKIDFNELSNIKPETVLGKFKLQSEN